MYSEEPENTKVKDKIAELKDKIKSKIFLDDMREVVLNFLQSIEDIMTITILREKQEEDLLQALENLGTAWDMKVNAGPRRQALSYAMGALTAVMEGVGQTNQRHEWGTVGFSLVNHLSAYPEHASYEEGVYEKLKEATPTITMEQCEGLIQKLVQESPRNVVHVFCGSGCNHVAQGWPLEGERYHIEPNSWVNIDRHGNIQFVTDGPGSEMGRLGGNILGTDPDINSMIEVHKQFNTIFENAIRKFSDGHQKPTISIMGFSRGAAAAGSFTQDINMDLYDDKCSMAVLLDPVAGETEEYQRGERRLVNPRIPVFYQKSLYMNATRFALGGFGPTEPVSGKKGEGFEGITDQVVRTGVYGLHGCMFTSYKEDGASVEDYQQSKVTWSVVHDCLVAMGDYRASDKMKLLMQASNKLHTHSMRRALEEGLSGFLESIKNNEVFYVPTKWYAKYKQELRNEELGPDGKPRVSWVLRAEHAGRTLYLDEQDLKQRLDWIHKVDPSDLEGGMVRVQFNWSGIPLHHLPDEVLYELGDYLSENAWGNKGLMERFTFGLVQKGEEWRAAPARESMRVYIREYCEKRRQEYAKSGRILPFLVMDKMDGSRYDIVHSESVNTVKRLREKVIQFRNIMEVFPGVREAATNTFLYIKKKAEGLKKGRSSKHSSMAQSPSKGVIKKSETELNPLQSGNARKIIKPVRGSDKRVSQPPSGIKIDPDADMHYQWKVVKKKNNDPSSKQGPNKKKKMN